MSRKFSRLVLVASMAAGFGVAPMLGANATGRGVDAQNNTFVGSDGNALSAFVGDDISWRILDGTHTVTPYDEKQWGQKGSGDLDPGTDQYKATHFDKPGQYLYFCKYHGGGTKDNPTGMWGVVNVTDPTPNTQPPATQPPATQPPATQPPPTQPPPTTATTAHPAGPAPTTATTAPAPASSAGAHPATTAAPAPTTTTAAKADKSKAPKDGSTTTSAPPPPAPVDLPDSAIIPTLPGAPSTVQDGAVVEAPGSTPEGDAVALIKHKHGHKGTMVLVVTGLGIGALGIGTAGYKFANRSSKYFPA
ncbi:MAG: hypothetical protein QOI86_1061 [Actinomycetota bacterium]|nr:hypothetical protein [Actinomycetota bacterium]